MQDIPHRGGFHCFTSASFPVWLREPYLIFQNGCGGAVAGGIVTQESRRVVGAVFSRDLYRFQKRPPEGQ